MSFDSDRLAAEGMSYINEIKPDLNDIKNHKILFSASSNGQIDVIEYIFDLGLPIKEVLSKYTGSLYIATIFGRLDVIKYFVSRGLTVDDIRADGAFEGAISDGGLDIVKYFIDIGLNMEDIRTHYVEDEIICAIERKRYPLLQIFYDNFPESHAILKHLGADMTLFSPLVKRAC